MRPLHSLLSVRIVLLIALAICPSIGLSQEATPVVYTIRLAEAQQQTVEIRTVIPTGGKESIVVAMPIWSPGFYVVQNYAGQVSDVAATTADEKTLDVEQSQSNRWTISTSQADPIILSYHLKCERCSVTTNWIEESFAVFNGGATFMFPVGDSRRPIRLRIELPEHWQAFTGLEAVSESPSEFAAPDYETLVDSPIIAGNPRTFGSCKVHLVGSSKHWKTLRSMCGTGECRE